LLVAVFAFIIWVLKAILRAIFSVFTVSDQTLNRRS
jgi:hypothetical protein